MNRFCERERKRREGRADRARLSNYADDFVILSRGHAVEALEWTRWAMGKLSLTLNETKTCIRKATTEPSIFWVYVPARGESSQRATYSGRDPRRRCTKLKEKIGSVLSGESRPVAGKWQARLKSDASRLGELLQYGTRYPAYRAIDRYVRTDARLSQATTQDDLGRRQAV